jgi:hypothetical protein
MSHITSNRRKPATATVAIPALLLACVGLAACGGSSSSSTTSASASATTPADAAGTDRRLGEKDASRRKALRECLQKNGITPPQRAPGQRRSSPGGPGGFLGGGAGGPQLPKGVTRAQYEAAIKKCGGGAFVGRGGRIESPAFKRALTKFAACMRENGVNVPAPNTSGNGPIFDTKGIDTASTQFRAAESKCSKDLQSAFRRGPRARTAPGTAPGGAPPSGEAPGGSATG